MENLRNTVLKLRLNLLFCHFNTILKLFTVGPERKKMETYKHRRIAQSIGVRAGGGARGAAAPPKFGQLRFFGQQEKIWAKPVFKDVSMFFFIIIILKR